MSEFKKLMESVQHFDSFKQMEVIGETLQKYDAEFTVALQKLKVQLEVYIWYLFVLSVKSLSFISSFFFIQEEKKQKRTTLTKHTQKWRSKRVKSFEVDSPVVPQD